MQIGKENNTRSEWKSLKELSNLGPEAVATIRHKKTSNFDDYDIEVDENDDFEVEVSDDDDFDI